MVASMQCTGISRRDLLHESILFYLRRCRLFWPEVSYCLRTIRLTCSFVLRIMVSAKTSVCMCLTRASLVFSSLRWLFPPSYHATGAPSPDTVVASTPTMFGPTQRTFHSFSYHCPWLCRGVSCPTVRKCPRIEAYAVHRALSTHCIDVLL
jgi:hypothetical protein